MNTQQNTKRTLIFLALAFGIPWAAALASYLTGDLERNQMKAIQLVNYVFILTPALANVATRLITRQGWRNLYLRPNFRRGWRYYLAAWLLPPLAIITGAAVYYLFFPQSLDLNLSQVRKLFAGTAFEAAPNPWVLMASLFVQIMILNVLILGIQSIGEEFGWRAYLLPRLVERFAGARSASSPAGAPAQSGGQYAAGARKAALLVGVIWTVWHWPMFFMQMSFDPTMPVLFPLVYLLSTCSLSVLLCWATLRSGSVWPAVIGHAANNWIIFLVMLTLKGPVNPLLGPSSTGLISVSGYLVLALVLLVNRRAFAEGEVARRESPVLAYPTMVAEEN